MVTNWPMMIIALLFLFVSGGVCLFSPITIAKIITRNPNPTAYPEETLPPKVREALRLIKENPQEYARRFSNQISYIRVMGGVAWSMFFIALFATLHSLYLLYF